MDRFNDTRTYRKTAKPTPGATAYHHEPKPAGNRPDAATRRMMAVENETESFAIEKTPSSLANRLKALRAQKEWTQKDLATRSSVRIDIIRDLENCKGTPDPKIIAKLEQCLGGSLRDKPAKKK